jgi:hypothetical protein
MAVSTSLRLCRGLERSLACSGLSRPSADCGAALEALRHGALHLFAVRVYADRWWNGSDKGRNAVLSRRLDGEHPRQGEEGNEHGDPGRSLATDTAICDTCA